MSVVHHSCATELCRLRSSFCCLDPVGGMDMGPYWKSTLQHIKPFGQPHGQSCTPPPLRSQVSRTRDVQ
eukprot:6025857-Amphidinium_carterae.1